METVTRCHFLLVGLSPCVVPKNLFLEKISPYARDAHACKWSGSRVEKLKIFSPEQNGVQFLQFCQGRDLIGAHI